MERLVTTLGGGSFPVLGVFLSECKCTIRSTIIPCFWPNVVVSNLPLYGNIICFETFVRVLVSSLPHGQLGLRFPGLQEVAKEILRLMGTQRSGIPYCKEMLELLPADLVTAK